MTLETLIQRYETALNANDIDTILSLYGSEPVFMPQNAPAMVGLAAVRAAYEQVFATIQLDVRFTTHEIDANGDTAWARTSSSGRTRVLAADVVVDEGNNELFVFKRTDGEWKIHRYLFATNQPRA
jgi:ketosteroid isomerase-like protein